MACHSDRFAQLNWPIETPLGLQHAFGEPSPKLRRKPVRQPRHDPLQRFGELVEVFGAFDIADGQTLSFHHHYRNGDRVMNAVLLLAQEIGLKNLTIAPSSIFPCHEVLVPLILDGTITNVVTDYMKGPFADCISDGKLDGVCLLQSHGGRARAVSTGELKIDVAFIGAAIGNTKGDLSGRQIEGGCGPLGYPAVDASVANYTVGLVHKVTEDELPLVDIPGKFVDGILHFDNPGAATGIKSGATVPSKSPATKKIANLVVGCIEAVGLLQNGVSIQSGAGGHSLAAVADIGHRMRQKGVKGSFISGGITEAHVTLLQECLFDEIRDVQCFDLEAVRSSFENPNHFMMTADEYANPLRDDAYSNNLSVMLLGAVEIDENFDVNVVTGGNGRVLGGPGGHPDTAEGAKLTIVTTELVAGGFAKLVSDVRTVTTLGQHIDLIATDHGVVVNHAREDLKSTLTRAGIPIAEFEDLRTVASANATSQPTPPAMKPTILIESRNGLILDWA